MGYDPFSPIAPALINVLCVPAGRVSSVDFSGYLQWLRVNAGSTNASTLIDQNGLEDSQTGHADKVSVNSPLLFQFGQHLDGDILQNDAYFEPNRQPQLVLGLVNGTTLLLNDPEAAISLLEDATSGLRLFTSQLGLNQSSGKLFVFDCQSPFEFDSVVFVQSSDSGSSIQHVQALLSTAATSVISSRLDVTTPDSVVLPTLAVRFDKLSHAETRRDSKNEDVRRQSVASTSSRGTPATQVANGIAEDGAPSVSASTMISTALLSMQQGQWKQALDTFTTGARFARDSAQHAWHAKALEGILICMLLLAWNGDEFQIPQDCYPTGRGFSSSGAVHSIADANRTISEKFAGNTADRLQALTAMLPGLLATTMNLYDKAATGFGDNFPRLLACEARVRFAVMLVIVKKHGGILNSQALAELLGSCESAGSMHHLEPPAVSLNLRSASLGHLLIESILEAQAHLPIQSAAAIYLTVCQNLSSLRLDRKQGFYLKEILQRLPPVFVEARRAGSAGVIVPTAASDRQQDRVSQGVRALLQLAAQAYGLPVDRIETTGETLEEIQSHAQQRLSSWFTVYSTGNIATKLEVLRLCVRVADALPDPVGSIQFMSLLLHVARQSITVIPGPSNVVPLISSDEQRKLVAGIQNVVGSTQMITSTKVPAEYWDDFLVRGVTLFEHPSAGKLMLHSSQDLSTTSSMGVNEKDPFIYNPFSGSRSATGPAVLVKDELVSFEVVLQNPLEIELEIESISLTTDGAEFDAKVHSVVLGPLCLQVFTLKGIPTGTGSLKLTGCKARIKNCREQNFAIFTGNWKPSHLAKPKNALLTENVQLPASTTLELNIVDSLPSLSVNEKRLAQQNVMLLDGEKYDFSIELENTSDLDADLILFSNEDSVSHQVQDALSTKDLQPADMYELQHQLTTRPAIRRELQPDTLESGRPAPIVSAKSKKKFDFSVLGKPGLTEVTVLVDYAHIGRPRNEIEGSFYMRQLRYMVNVTVNGSIDLPRCSILSMPPTARLPALQSIIQQPDKDDTSGLPLRPPPETCLLQLDIRSIWQTPLRVTVETNFSQSRSTSSDEQANPSTPSWIPATTLTILPTQITRTLLPIPKIYIPNPFEKIPSLSPKNRQFVISASKVSVEADLAARELFWYRECLISMLRVTWEEEYGKRSGEIDVRRGLRLSSRMIDALRVEHVQVTFDLKAVRDTESHVVKEVNREDHGNGNADYDLTRNIFANLVVRVSNYTTDPLRLMLRLQPSLHNQSHNVAIDLGKKFVWSGVLQRVFRTPVQAGESVEMGLGVVGLVAGEYEVNATVEEIRARVGRRNNGGGGDDVRSENAEKIERRIWHAKRPCLIRVVDEEG